MVEVHESPHAWPVVYVMDGHGVEPNVAAEIVPDAVIVDGQSEAIEYHPELTSNLDVDAAYAWSAVAIDDLGRVVRDIAVGEGTLTARGTAATMSFVVDVPDGFYALRLRVGIVADELEDATLAVQFLSVGDGVMREMSASDWYRTEPSTIPDEYKYWRPVREGVLTADEEAALHSAVGYDDASKAPVCGMSNALDIAVARMWNGEQTYRCAGGPEAPPGWPMRAELYAAGSTVDGPMRIKVSVVPVQSNDLKYEWPLDAPIVNYLVDYDRDESFRIDDEAAVNALVRLREKLIADATKTPGYYRGHIGILPGSDVLDPGQGYALAVRDELPFTDGNGKWSPSQ